MHLLFCHLDTPVSSGKGIDLDTSVWTWGSGLQGQLGHGDTNDR